MVPALTFASLAAVARAAEATPTHTYGSFVDEVPLASIKQLQ